MAIVYLIRHGRTKGNLEGRYVGRTDEPLCEEGIREVNTLRNAWMRIIGRDAGSLKYADRGDNICRPTEKGIEGGLPAKVYVSPMLRCRQTAELLFPNAVQEVMDDFREMDFGEFEYKNYEELSDDLRYQAFIDSGGMTDFPGAESQQQFRQRVRDAFARCIHNMGASMTKPETDLSQEPFAFAVKPGQVLYGQPMILVVHGGTIMSILEAFAQPHGDYFDWQIPPGSGYRCRLIHTGAGLRLENPEIVI